AFLAVPWVGKVWLRRVTLRFSFSKASPAVTIPAIGGVAVGRAEVSIHEDRGCDVLHHGLHAARTAGEGAGGARVRIAVGARAHAHPLVAQDGLSGGRRPG